MRKDDMLVVFKPKTNAQNSTMVPSVGKALKQRHKSNSVPQQSKPKPSPVIQLQASVYYKPTHLLEKIDENIVCSLQPPNSTEGIHTGIILSGTEKHHLVNMESLHRMYTNI